MEVSRSYQVLGKVQGVMFRQTVVKAALNRGLQVGATNDKLDHGLVWLSLKGDEEVVEGLIHDLEEIGDLNSWQARPTKVELCDNFVEIFSHEVHSENVDQIKWSEGVDFYLK